MGWRKLIPGPFYPERDIAAQNDLKACHTL